MNGLIVFSLLVIGSNAGHYGGTYGGAFGGGFRGLPIGGPFGGHGGPIPLGLPGPAPLPLGLPGPGPLAITRPLPVPIAAPLPLAAPLRTFSAPVIAAPLAIPAPVPQVYGPIEAAVHTRRTFEVRPVLLEQDLAVPQVLEVSPNYEAVQIHFRTASSRLNAIQSHESFPGTVEHTASEDAPHKLVHEVRKPVIQEVREVILPFRRITQEILPVAEEIHTIVHKGERVYAAPLPLRAVGPAYGAGAALAVNAGYKAAKAA